MDSDRLPAPPASPRERKVLQHIGRYKITLRETLSHLFLDGKDAGNLVQALKAKGFIRTRSRRSGDGLPNAVSFYQLTAEGAVAAGLQKELARGLDSDLDPHESLAVLWHCCMSSAARDRLKPSEIARFLETEELPVPLWRHPCCRVAGSKGYVLQQAYVPGSGTRLENRVRGVLRRIRSLERAAPLGELVRSRNLGILVLVEESAQKHLLRERIGKLGLQRRARISVSLAPSPATLARALSEWRDKFTTTQEGRP